MSHIPIAAHQTHQQFECVRRSFVYCRRIAVCQATNFHYGMRLVPEPKRSATYALYAWLRQADDLADGEGDPAEKIERLERFWAETRSWTDPANEPIDDRNGELLWPAFRQVVLQYNLPTALLREHIQGQLWDQQKTGYATLEELYEYCRKVAAVVGLLCIRIWGYEGGEQTCQLAEQRGIAFQMTNILRDVREDALRGRVYIPSELFDGRPLTPECLIESPSTALVEVVRVMADRAAECYAASAGLEQHVHPDGRKCLWAMTQVYSGLLERILEDPAVVLHGQRLRLPRLAKLWIAMRAICR